MLTNQPTNHPPTRPLRLAPGELWCRRCGNSGSTSQARDGEQRDAAECPRCGGHDWIEAVTVLRPHEYIIN